MVWESSGTRYVPAFVAIVTVSTSAQTLFTSPEIAKVLAVPVPLPYAQNCRFVAPVANAGVTAELPVALNLMEYVPLKLVPTYGELE